MSELFLYPDRLWLVALLPAGLIAVVLSERSRRRALARFSGSMPAPRLAPGLWPGGRIWRAVLGLVAGAFLAVTLARPQWGERSEQIVRRGVDIILALDTSRSMACEDVRPSRFERARLAVSDLLRSRAGDRIALLPFTEQAAVSCPLTLDYGAVRLFLDASEVARDGSP